MKTYIYPENLRASVKLWFWSVRDLIIIYGTLSPLQSQPAMLL